LGLKPVFYYNEYYERNNNSHFAKFFGSWWVFSVGRIIFLILLTLWTFSTNGFGQTCYQQLSDLSGTEFTASQLSDLEQSACDLIDSLPQAYQDSSAVLDYGFYLHEFGF